MTDLYLYQTVHVARGRALHVAKHAAVLDAASREWFGRPYTPSPGALRTEMEPQVITDSAFISICAILPPLLIHWPGQRSL